MPRINPPKGPKATVDTSLLSPERIEELRKEAAAKVEAARILAAEKQLLEQFENEERQAHGAVAAPGETMVDIVIDLAPYCSEIRIDGVIYFQGHRYTVREGAAAGIAEIMANTWKHQSEIDGKSENFYRKTRGQGVTPGGVVSNILRV